MTSVPGEASGGAAGGEVFDLGYRHYDGPREGRWRSRRTIWRDGVRTTLGLGRSVSKKVAPFGLIALAWLPAVIVIVITGFVSTFGGDIEEIEGPTFGEYYGWAFIFITLFSAVVAPELLCPDRRQGVITLYLVRPITPIDYVAARWSAFFIVLLFVLWIPQALLFGWDALSADEPLRWTSDHWDAIPRFLAAGAVIAAPMTTLAMMASSFTTRRPYAAVATLAIVLIGVALSELGQAFSGDVGDRSTLLNVGDVALTVSDSIFGEEFSAGSDRPLSGVVYAAWLSFVTLAAAAAIWWRYRVLAR